MSDDSEGWDLFAEGERRDLFPGEWVPGLGRPRRCGECRRAIVPGELYLRWAGRYDRVWSVGAMCAHCRVASRWLVEMCDGFLYGGVLEDLVEHVGEGHGTDPWLCAFVAGMRRRWCWPGGRLMPVPQACPPQAKLLSVAGWPRDEDEEEVWVP